MTVSTKTKKILTGGKGIVKIWDISDELESDHDNDGSSRSSSRNGSRSNLETKEIHRLNGLPDGNYIRSCKIFSNGQKLIVGGEANKLSYWDLNASGGPTKMTDLQLQAPACYALCIPESDNVCYACCSDGMVSVWDLRTCRPTSFQAHTDGASCVDIVNGKLWTGGLDNMVKCWDINNSSSAVASHELGAQVSS